MNARAERHGGRCAAQRSRCAGGTGKVITLLSLAVPEIVIDTGSHETGRPSLTQLRSYAHPTAMAAAVRTDTGVDADFEAVDAREAAFRGDVSARPRACARRAGRASGGAAAAAAADATQRCSSNWPTLPR